MHVIPFMLKELEQEAETTRKFFGRIKQEDFQWQPHEKNMTLQKLSSHIAGLPIFVDVIINSDQLDFANNNLERQVAETPEDLNKILDAAMQKATTALLSVRNEDDLLKTWTLKRGDTIIAAMSKYEAIRRMTLSHLIHHRSQLGVYLRLMNIAVPGTYGPSADEKLF